MFKVNHLVKRYQKETIALDHVSLEMKESEILGILGPNGSGKSTLINCILGLLKYEKGEISVFNQPLSDATKKMIGVVPQDLALIDVLSVEDNIDYFCGLYIQDAKTRKQYVEEAIQFVALQEHRKKKVKKLSGGLKRRLNIACGIAHKPKLIFLDEPTVAIDPQSRNFILEGLKSLKEQGISIVYTTHYMEEAEILCDRIAIMDIANIITVGTKHEIMQQNNISAIVKIVVEDNHFEFPQGIKKIEEHKYILEKMECFELLLEKLQKENIQYQLLEVNQPTLNDIFLLLTGKTLRDA